MRRILSLDGGGIRGVFSLEVLVGMQQMLRDHTGNPNLVLADHFDLFAGTSTGAIIATCLCWGMDANDVLNLYKEKGRIIFQHMAWYGSYKSRFDPRPLTRFLQEIFSEDGDGRELSLLGTSRLRRLLLVVLRDQSTGSAWPITNNPQAMFNDPKLPDCNLKIPLWQLLRASTAAPTYFPPEPVMLGDREHIFVDGAITPYNNPALIAALSAIVPTYRLCWPTGPSKIRLVSIGTLRFSTAALHAQVKRMWAGYYLSRIPEALIQGISQEQDLLCRCLGQCLHGEPLDIEVGDLINLSLPSERWFSYVRYTRSYSAKEIEDVLAKNPTLSKLDAVEAINDLSEVGRDYAARNLKISHLI